MKKKILLFEPSIVLGKTLINQMSAKSDFEVMVANSLTDFKVNITNLTFDLIIMDMDQNGYDFKLLSDFINENMIGANILYLINENTYQSTIFEQRIGKSAFLIKPFRVSYLDKKVLETLAKISNANEVFHKIGPFVFFPNRRIMALDGKMDIELTEKETNILKCLVNSGNEPIEKEELLKQVWNYNSDVTTHTLETHIYRLRQKLEINSTIPRLIISKSGGFKLSSH